MSREWQERKRPLRLENRFEFASYDDLRDFLDQAADLSESEDFYPDMGFGRNYVSITIHPEEDSDAIEPKKREFAEMLAKLRDTFPPSEA